MTMTMKTTMLHAAEAGKLTQPHDSIRPIHCSLIVIITDGERVLVIAAAAEEPEIGKGGIARWMCDKKRTNFHLGTAVASSQLGTGMGTLQPTSTTTTMMTSSITYTRMRILKKWQQTMRMR